ncbi:S1 RNA-binding domain-containing protein [Streptococcus pneumoniae]|nr:S1 RNA-binding domain-containing protein [Streptococcus pneumoniae]
MCFTHSFFHFAIFENLFKPRQRRISSNHVSVALSTTSKPCFEQPAASFLVCSLIFIEY